MNDITQQPIKKQLDPLTCYQRKNIILCRLLFVMTAAQIISIPFYTRSTGTLPASSTTIDTPSATRLNNSDVVESEQAAFQEIEITEQQVITDIDYLNYSPGFFILGMHRSGTSALAGTLNLTAGYNTGSGKLIGARKANPKGYFESESLVIQNMNWMELLNILPMGKQPLQSSPNFTFDPAALELNTKGEDVLRSLDMESPWLLKDPRLCIMLPAWLHHLEKYHQTTNSTFRYKPAIVMTIRDPWEVISSLHKRDRMGYASGCQQWYYHSRQAVEGSRGLCIVKTSYRDILDKPQETVEYIIHELTTKCHVHPPSNLTNKTSFVDGGLRTNHVNKTTGAYYVPHLIGNCTYPKPENIDNETLANLIPTMQLYCDMENGKAFESDYVFPKLPYTSKERKKLLELGQTFLSQ